jgi:hypothetical protein
MIRSTLETRLQCTTYHVIRSVLGQTYEWDNTSLAAELLPFVMMLSPSELNLFGYTYSACGTLHVDTLKGM